MGEALARRLAELDASRSSDWRGLGPTARPNLHGLLRYPAMMVPRMQGDIIDAVLSEAGPGCVVVDPFVGSGTVMTEAMARGLDFLGVDINPLAIVACEAKAAIDRGVDVEAAASAVSAAMDRDDAVSVDVDFPGLGKWFLPPAAEALSRIRRSVLSVRSAEARKVLWTVMAETVRTCSNSRVNALKLHLRPDGVRVGPEAVLSAFRRNLDLAVRHAADHRSAVAGRARIPMATLVCGDVRTAGLAAGPGHRIVVTSPPYGDNGTTIPYGQSSYLATRWIPADELPGGRPDLVATSETLDTNSLGGTLRGADAKAAATRGVSPALDAFLAEADSRGLRERVRKVPAFMSDFLDALRHLRSSVGGGSHWVVTTGNRTAAGMPVPFDRICAEMVAHLGGRPVASLTRPVAGKRMPARNGISDLITVETTLVAEFA